MDLRLVLRMYERELVELEDRYARERARLVLVIDDLRDKLAAQMPRGSRRYERPGPTMTADEERAWTERMLAGVGTEGGEAE